jgi:hypothetical protein
MPKILRGYFLRNRELLGYLSRAAWETVRALMAEAAGDPGVRPGMVVVPQTFGSSVNPHPHVHAIASRGGWTRDGTWVPIPYVDAGAAARLFRHKVLRLLLDAELIDEDRVEMILGWRHTSGFSVHNAVVVQAGDGDGLERLARYLARPPVSLQRMEWDRETGEVVYRTGRGHAEERGSEDGSRDDVRDVVERIDELEFLARVVTQLPEPRKHSIRYYGYYAAVVRVQRRRAAAETEVSVAAVGNDAEGNDACEARGKGGGVRPAVAAQAAVGTEPDTAARRQLRKNWAALIRRVYEVDPLLCVCGATMRIVAVITERSVITKILAHLAKAAAAIATEGAATRWCDHRTGRGLFEQAHSAAQARQRRPSHLAPPAGSTETACTFLAGRSRIVSTDGKRCDKLEKSHSVDSSAKCFFLSPTELTTTHPSQDASSVFLSSTADLK